nr:hypothetical protein [Actinomycetales bacterium]
MITPTPEDAIWMLARAHADAIASLDAVGRAIAAPWSDDAADFYEARRREVLVFGTRLAADIVQAKAHLASVAAASRAHAVLAGLA